MTLQLIQGVVSRLEIQQGVENFFNREATEAIGFGLTVGLLGSTGASSGSLSAARALDESVEFFSCLIGENEVSGQFSKVTFKDSDFVQVVCETQRSGRFPALAVRRPVDQTLWMYPHCSRGMRQHIKYTAKMMVAIFVASEIFGVLLLELFQLMDGKRMEPGFHVSMLTTYLVTSLVGSVYILGRIGIKFGRFVKRAEAIFAALGYADPKNVDLEKGNKEYWKSTPSKAPPLFPSDGAWTYRYVAKNPKKI